MHLRIERGASFENIIEINIDAVWFRHFNAGVGGSPGGASDNPPANAGDIRDPSLILGLGRSPGGGHGNPLQSSCLENPMDRGARRATVHRVAKNQT